MERAALFTVTRVSHLLVMCYITIRSSVLYKHSANFSSKCPAHPFEQTIYIYLLHFAFFEKMGIGRLHIRNRLIHSSP